MASLGGGVVGSTEHLNAVVNTGAMTFGQVVSALVTGGEYRNDVIASFYSLYLNRGPSSSELNYWQGQFSGGESQLSIQESIIGSGEYALNPAVPAGGSAYRSAKGRGRTFAERNLVVGQARLRRATAHQRRRRPRVIDLSCDNGWWAGRNRQDRLRRATAHQRRGRPRAIDRIMR